MNRLPNLGGYTPSDLQDMGMSVLMYLNALALTTSDRSADSLSALKYGVPPSGGPVEAIEHRKPEIGNSEAALTPLPELRASVVKRRKARSKASHLPSDIQHNLNSMLANGRPYAEIIRSLTDQGHPGFNKVNLHNWKATGYRDWLRAKNPEVRT